MTTPSSSRSACTTRTTAAPWWVCAPGWSSAAAELESRVGTLPRLPVTRAPRQRRCAAASAAAEQLAAELTEGIAVDPQQRSHRAAGTRAPGRSPRLAPARRQAGVVGVLRAPGRVGRRAHRRLGVARRAGVQGRRRRREAVAPVPIHVPAAGEQVARRGQRGGPAHVLQRRRATGRRAAPAPSTRSTQRVARWSSNARPPRTHCRPRSSPVVSRTRACSEAPSCASGCGCATTRWTGREITAPLATSCCGTGRASPASPTVRVCAEGVRTWWRRRGGAWPTPMPRASPSRGHPAQARHGPAQWPSSTSSPHPGDLSRSPRSHIGPSPSWCAGRARRRRGAGSACV